MPLDRHGSDLPQSIEQVDHTEIFARVNGRAWFSPTHPMDWPIQWVKWCWVLFLQTFVAAPKVYDSTLDPTEKPREPYLIIVPAITTPKAPRDLKPQSAVINVTFKKTPSGVHQASFLIFGLPWYQLRALFSVSNTKLGRQFAKALEAWNAGHFKTLHTDPYEQVPQILMGRLIFLLHSLDTYSMFSRDVQNQVFRALTVNPKYAVELPLEFEFRHVARALAQIFGYQKIKITSSTGPLESLDNMQNGIWPIG
jgi:hypothetical protein